MLYIIIIIIITEIAEDCRGFESSLPCRLLWAFNQDLVGIFDKFQVEYVFIDILHHLNRWKLS